MNLRETLHHLVAEVEKLTTNRADKPFTAMHDAIDHAFDKHEAAGSDPVPAAPDANPPAEGDADAPAQ